MERLEQDSAGIEDDLSPLWSVCELLAGGRGHRGQGNGRAATRIPRGIGQKPIAQRRDAELSLSRTCRKGRIFCAEERCAQSSETVQVCADSKFWRFMPAQGSYCPPNQKQTAHGLLNMERAHDEGDTAHFCL